MVTAPRKSAIDSVRRIPEGFSVTFEASDGGWWVGHYNRAGRLTMTVWQPEEHVSYLDPAELERLAAAGESSPGQG